MNRVMVDLETLDTGGDALIISIGAVIFNPFLYKAGEPFKDLGSSFYTVVNQDLQEKKWGRTKSPSTLKWWSEQGEEAKQVLIDSDPAQFAPKLDTALQMFGQWWGGTRMELWGNGATFDNVILRNAYDAVGLQTPWHFTDDRCYRTLKNLGIRLGNGEGCRMEDFGVAHNALADAKYQAVYASAWLRKIHIQQGREG